MEKRMFKEALEQFEKVEKTDHLLATMSKIRLYGLSDRPDEAKRLFLELSRSKDFETIRSLDLAVLYASIGDREKAFEVLEMVRIGPGGIARLKYEPDFDLLRSDPRFAKLVDGQKSVPVTQP
jgi:hypothetical protein